MVPLGLALVGLDGGYVCSGTTVVTRGELPHALAALAQAVATSATNFL